MTVYLDIVLFENLCMNYIILFATGIVMKRKINHVKLLLSSLLGSAYAIIIYLKIITIASNIIMKIILSIAMVWLSFGSNYKSLLKDLLMFYLISFVFGGCSFALIYFIKPENVKIHNGVLVGLYPIKVTLIAGVIAFIIIQIAFKITKNKLSSSDMICSMIIYLFNKKITVKTLIDSGNMLRDPISGYPVAVVEEEEIQKILPEKFEKIINSIRGGDELNTEINDFASKIRAIPFSSLGKQNGILMGVKADKIKIIFKEQETYIDNVIIGIYNKKFTKENRYQALIGLEMLEGSDKIEYTTDIEK